MTSPPQGDAKGPDLHLLHSTACSKATYTTTSPSALVAHLKNKLRRGKSLLLCLSRTICELNGRRPFAGGRHPEVLEVRLELRAERQAEGIAAAKRREAAGALLPGKEKTGRPAAPTAELAALRHPSFR